MARTDAIEVEGVVVRALRPALYQIELSNGHRLLGHFKGRNRKNPVQYAPGDRIMLEMSPFDLSKGRIIVENERNT